MQALTPLEQAIIAVGRHFEDGHIFTSRAFQASQALSLEQAQGLPAYFHENPPEPEELKEALARHGILGVWMSVCQRAIFEILYHYKEKALPILYPIAFGVYDWTQYGAIGILCRLADEGIATNEILSRIQSNIGSFRDEALFPSLYYLSKIKGNTTVDAIFKEIVEEWKEDDPIDTYYFLKDWSIHYPDSVRQYLPFLKSMAMEEGVEGTFEKEHRVHAARLFQELEKGDEEVNAVLGRWAENGEG